MTLQPHTQTHAWLAELQAAWSDAIRAPLHMDTGTLRADIDAYPPALLARLAGPDPTTGLATYHRQYWFRLLEVLQSEFALTTHLLGPWAMNAFALPFLTDHPPRQVDIGHAADGFAAYVAAHVHAWPPIPGRPAVLDEPRLITQAAQVDEAWRAAHLAPPVTPWTPRAEELADLSALHLTFSPGFTVLHLNWPLLQWRRALQTDASPPAFRAPPPPQPAEDWAMFPLADGLAELPLTSLHAELLRQLAVLPVGAALERVSRACPRRDRARLPELTQAWLAQGVELGMWRGVERRTSDPGA